ncbi:MAG: class II fructose-bisphosphate aldolase [Candidatus Harrisonbacteria bacterium]|nr:class II fructose-bisphosphate aldolase [Candidatus Harrisonbacteria bacterium]
MDSLREIIADAAKRKIALGHFNISDIAGLKAIVLAAVEVSKELGEEVPVLIGTSEGEREFLGAENAVSLVRNMREEFGHPIFLNADHTYSLEKVREAALLGYDSIIFDGAKMSLEENIAQTRAAVELAKKINPEIIVEGELGYIGTSSALLEKLPEGAQITEKDLTTPEDAARFVKETGVDLFAPAVGNIHGMLSGAENPALNIARIGEIAKAVSVPLVLHGGSGLKDEEFVAAAKNGVAVIHINTEIRLAWRKGLEKAFAEKPKEVAPYKLLSYSVEEMKQVVGQRLKLFRS